VWAEPGFITRVDFILQAYPYWEPGSRQWRPERLETREPDCRVLLMYSSQWGAGFTPKVRWLQFSEPADQLPPARFVQEVSRPSKLGGQRMLCVTMAIGQLHDTDMIRLSFTGDSN